MVVCASFSGIIRLDLLADKEAHLVYDDVTENISDKQDAAVILAEMERLPPQLKQAVDLNVCQGVTLKDAAAMMGVSLQRAQQCKESGLRKLRNSKAARMIGLDYYRHHVGLRRFKQTHTSVVEETILWLERQGYSRAESAVESNN